MTDRTTGHNHIDDVDKLWSAIAAHAEDLAGLMTEAILQLDDGYGEADRDSLTSSMRSIIRHFQLFRHDKSVLADDVIEVGRKRARQGFSLETLLHGWRIGGHAMWDWLIDQASRIGNPTAAIDVWTDYLSYVDGNVSGVTKRYVDEREHLRMSEIMESNASLDLLLRGASASQKELLLRRLGISGPSLKLGVCAIIDRQSNEESFAPLLTPLSQSYGKHIPWVVREDVLTILLENTGELHPRLSDGLRRAGSEFRIGLSRSFPSTGSIEPGKRQAAAVLSVTTPERPLVDFDELTVPQICAATSSVHWDDLPGWLTGLIEDDVRSDGVWRQTARALVESSLRIGEAAKALVVHPNTIYYRLNVVKERYGVDLRSPEVLLGIEIVSACVDFGTLHGYPLATQRL